jgi:hypothetical protein
MCAARRRRSPRRCSGRASQIITECERTATARWCDHLVAASDGDLLLRAGVPPQHLALYWQMLPEDVRASGAWFVDVAAGLIYRALCRQMMRPPWTGG